ncbi:MAG: polyprenyl diphosphate synthase [Candidatus Altiarchaeota archaeon]
MHIALIPDGNRRYMRKKGALNLKNSYQEGISHFFDFVNWCRELGVNQVTIYALSLENIGNRDKSEIETLFRVFNEQAEKAMGDKRIMKEGVKVNVCGDRDTIRSTATNPGLGGKLIDNLEKLEEKTRDHDKLVLNLAMGYGGRQEIINAAKKVVEEGLELNDKNIESNLWVKDNPDIIIRTSEDRLSNFLTWQSAYSEIYFSDKLWQEFTREDLEKIISDFKSRERRFGR